MKRMSDLNGASVVSAWMPNGSSDDPDHGWFVGTEYKWGRCTSITLYNEVGEMAYVPYLCVEFEDGTEIRAAARLYEVEIGPSHKEAKGSGGQ